MKNLTQTLFKTMPFFLGIALFAVVSLDAGTATNIMTGVIYTDDLQAAINAASSNDILEIEGTNTGSFTINNNINLSLVGVGTNPTLAGNGSQRVLTIGPTDQADIKPGSRTAPLAYLYPNINLSNLTITGGNALSSSNPTVVGIGGAILNINYNLTLNKVQIISNKAQVGGGAFANIFGAMTINDSAISSNSSDGGGAGLNLYSYLSINRSKFTGNSANIGDTGTIGSGGALLLGYGTNSIKKCLFESNSATGAAGAIVNYNNFETRLIHSRFRSNSGAVAGAIYNSGRLLCGKVLLSGNRAISGNGGGIYNDVAATLGLFSSKIVSNTSSGLGGGIYTQSCEPILGNKTVVKDNLPGNIYHGCEGDAQAKYFFGEVIFIFILEIERFLILLDV